VIPETPVRVEYSLTKKGRALAEAIDSIATWAEKYIPLAPHRTKPVKATRPRRRAAR
jgi:DNA-binding HxlR family transcriptional regulator